MHIFNLHVPMTKNHSKKYTQNIYKHAIFKSVQDKASELGNKFINKLYPPATTTDILVKNV